MTCGEWRKLKPASQLALRVFFELFYGDDSERAGVVVVRPSVLCDELGSSKRAIFCALSELVSIGVIEYDKNAAIACRVGFIHANLPKQRNNAKGWLDSLPRGRESFIITQAVAFIESRISQREPHGGQHSKSHSEPHCEPHSESPQDHRTTGPQDQELLGATAPKVEDKAPSKRKTFTKPTEAEVRDAFIAKGVHPSLAAAKATEFIGHYESNGWRVGKNPMRSWQGAVQTWFGRLRADGKLEGAARAMPAKPDPKLGRDDVWV